MEKNKSMKFWQEKPEHNPDKNRKIIQIICSIIVALGVWLYVGEEKVVSVSTSVHDLPVEFAGEDTTLAEKNLMLLSGYDTTVDLKLKGPRKVLWKLDKDEIRIVADTSSIQDTGMQTLTYQVIYPDNVQRSQIQVAWASLYSITVTVGELYTKEVPIHCDVTGKVADGFVAENTILDPTVLVLRAQRDDLLNVSYAKVNVDLDNAKETLIKTVEFQLYDYNDIPLDNDNIRATTKLIQVTVPVKTVKDVPLLINFVEATGSTMAQVDYSIDPEKVRLKGDKAVLDDISSIVLDTIYLQDLDEYQTLHYDINIPRDTELVGTVDEVTVTIVVEGVSERRVSSSNFDCINVPEGYTAEVVTESLSITLRGLSNQVSSITGENLKITADLLDVKEEGSFTVPVTVHINGYDGVGIKGSYQVIVNVAKAAEPTPDPVPDPGTTPTPENRAVPMPTAETGGVPAMQAEGDDGSVIQTDPQTTDSQAQNA